MTAEEKDLLLKDLCVRLPYGVMINYPLWDEERYDARLTGISEDGLVTLDVPADTVFDIQKDGLKPYLRPMSSMTEDERYEYLKFIIDETDDEARFLNKMVFYNKYHFDYRGLIPKGLAIEAPENMYKI